MSVVIYYANLVTFTIKIPGNGPVIFTKIISLGFVAHVYIFFLTAHDFDIYLAQPSQTSSITISLTTRVSYVKHNKFSMRFKYQ